MPLPPKTRTWQQRQAPRRNREATRCVATRARRAGRVCCGEEGIAERPLTSEPHVWSCASLRKAQVTRA